MTTRSLFAACAALIVAGCTAPTDTATYSDQLVVNAFLIGEQPIDSVYIQRTGKITDVYNDQSAAVTNAVVVVTGNNVTDTLAQDPARPGRYYSRQRGMHVRPGAAYSLAVRVPGYGDVSGTTTVPDTFSVTNSAEFPLTVRYAPATPPLSIAWSASAHYADYLAVVRSLDLSSAQIPKSFSTDTAPDRTETSFFLKDVKTTEISWLLINYYGKTEISMIAVDDNYFAFLKQAVAGQGASDIREMRFNLKGAIGVFGAETVANNRIILTVTP